jgi:hypothetical protein
VAVLLVSGLSGLAVAPGTAAAAAPDRDEPVHTTADATIWSKAFGYCLDVSGGNVTAGTQVILWKCHSGVNQQWEYRSDATIRPQGNPDLCLDVAGGDIHNGAGLIVWPCRPGGGYNQRWSTFGRPTQIKLFDYNQCLDADTGNPQHVQIWACGPSDKANQVWWF